MKVKKRAPDLEIYIPPGPRLGKSVVELSGLGKTMGDRMLMDGANALIPPATIVGVVSCRPHGYKYSIQMSLGGG